MSIVLAALLLAGCSDSAREVSFPVVPDELKDCSFYRLSNSGGDHLSVARCPNSVTSTTYPSGKTQATAIVVDGVEYERKN